MGTWDRELDLSFRGWTVATVLSAVAVLAWVVLLGTRARREPERCPRDFIELGSRCCALGQGSSRGYCVGAPESCPAPAQRVEEPAPGCVVPSGRVVIEGGSVLLGPTDWDAIEVERGRVVAVQSFELDSLEVTVHRYLECERQGLCEPLEHPPEPGLPVASVSAEQAERFCAFAGGHLPTPYQWVYAAAGKEARRYPWGAHGLVCRRAAFGLERGPCGEGGSAPELAGLRPDGATPDGLLDLAGNVAEWAKSPEGVLSVHGGSFRSVQPSQLKSWATRPAAVAADVGFRCAYSRGASAAR
jgi:formylglycine-generating enzyme required for sulfatase activity